MKYCEEYAVLLDLFVDGELPPAEMERVRAHLETCPGCRGYVDDALAIRAGFPDVEDTVVPEGFASGVMGRVREDAGKGAEIIDMKRRSVRRRMGALAMLAACCALVILVRTGTSVLSGGDSATTATSSADDSTSAGYAMDTGGADAGGDAWNDLQMAMEPAASPEEAKREAGEGQIEGEARMAADMDDSAVAEKFEEEFEKAANPSEHGDLAASPSAASPETSMSTVYTAGGVKAALYLTAEEAGDLLEGYTPVREANIVLDGALASPERWYELTGEEYRSLLEALGRPPETAEAPVLVVVAEPFE